MSLQSELLRDADVLIKRVKPVAIAFGVVYILIGFMNPFTLKIGMQNAVSVMVYHSILSYSLHGFTVLAISPFEGFMVSLNIAFILTMMVILPLITYEIVQYVLPGLSGKEKRYLRIGILPVFSFFVLGAIVAVLIIVPFLFDYAKLMDVSLGMIPSVSATQFISTFLEIVFLMGLVFEIPVIMPFLTAIGITSYEFYRSKWRYAVVGCYVLAILVSPPGIGIDILIWSMLSGLYVGGTRLSLYVQKKRIFEEHRKGVEQTA